MVCMRYGIVDVMVWMSGASHFDELVLWVRWLVWPLMTVWGDGRAPDRDRAVLGCGRLIVCPSVWRLFLLIYVRGAGYGESGVYTPY